MHDNYCCFLSARIVTGRCWCALQFLPDADDVLVLLIKVQTDREEFDDDDPQVNE